MLFMSQIKRQVYLFIFLGTNDNITHDQKYDSYVKTLSDNDVTTVEMLVELSEDDYVQMGLGLPFVRTMLRKAKLIVQQPPKPE